MRFSNQNGQANQGYISPILLQGVGTWPGDGHKNIHKIVHSIHNDKITLVLEAFFFWLDVSSLVSGVLLKVTHN